LYAVSAWLRYVITSAPVQTACIYALITYADAKNGSSAVANDIIIAFTAFGMLFIVWADSCSAAGDFCYVTNVNGIVKKIMIACQPNVVGKARCPSVMQPLHYIEPRPVIKYLYSKILISSRYNLH